MSRSLLYLVFAIGAVGSGCSREDKPAQAASVQTPPGQAAPAKPAAPTGDPRELVAKGATVIDVRTAEEYAEDRLPSATNIPVEELPQRLGDVEKLVAGDKSKPVVVYCESGSRAKKAKRQLEAAGYTQVVNGGGLDDLR